MGIFGKDDPGTVELNGEPLLCVVCRHGTFHRRSAELHGPVATFLDFEWTSPTCTVVICSACGYVHWFLPT